MHDDLNIIPFPRARKVLIGAQIALLIQLVIISYSSFADPPTQAMLDEVIDDIRAEAQFHIDTGSAPQTKDVVELFTPNSANLPPKDIRKHYQNFYSQASKERDAQNRIKETLKPFSWMHDPLAWLVGAALFFGGVLLSVLRSKLAKLYIIVGNYFYRNVAGVRLFRRYALRHYRRALVESFSQIHIPFRPNRPLDMQDVFVPLQVSTGNEQENISADDAFYRFDKIMITGPPGSGKSILLRKIALNIAQNNFNFRGNFLVPIFLELHRLNARDNTIYVLLAEALARLDFPSSSRFIKQGLKSGQFLILFDGLDEVTDTARNEVVLQLQDFLTLNSKCYYALSCRTVVYSGEFDADTDISLDIVEFSDQQIWRFLDAWEKDVPHGKAVGQLIGALRDRPEILRIARNPLLLTIIAHLFCDTRDFILPHSRGDFYQQSTDLLLHRWHKEINNYNQTVKRSILQCMALFSQDRARERGRDRRTLSVKETLSLVGNELPSLNIEKGEASKLISEIVDRSGLLLKIDGGARYQFAHLTLQEYFSAEALLNDEEKLFEYYDSDRTTWREVVKLWCSLASDSTSMIQRIQKIDALTAFECIADARKVDPEIAESVTETAKPKLLNNPDDATVLAFGTVAASRTGRGAKVFAFLEDKLRIDPDISIRKTAASALASTNLPAAAKLLLDVHLKTGQYPAELVSMGDVAANNLESFAAHGDVAAIDFLGNIGTPAAAAILNNLLWDNDELVASRAAWNIAPLLSEAAVRKSLRTLSLSAENRKKPAVDWILPTIDINKDSLGLIVSRLCYLLAYGPSEAIPKLVPTIDWRITLPLSGVILKPKFEFHIESPVLHEGGFGIYRSQIDENSRAENENTRVENEKFYYIQENDYLQIKGVSSDGQDLRQRELFLKDSAVHFFQKSDFWKLKSIPELKDWFIEVPFTTDTSYRARKIFLALPVEIQSAYFKINRSTNLMPLLRLSESTPNDWMNMFTDPFDPRDKWQIWVYGLSAMTIIAMAFVYSLWIVLTLPPAHTTGVTSIAGMALTCTILSALLAIHIAADDESFFYTWILICGVMVVSFFNLFFLLAIMSPNIKRNFPKMRWSVSTIFVWILLSTNGLLLAYLAVDAVKIIFDFVGLDLLILSSANLDYIATWIVCSIIFVTVAMGIHASLLINIDRNPFSDIVKLPVTAIR